MTRHKLDIIDFLKIDSSRLNADIVVDKIEEDPDRFDEVWKLALLDEPLLSMRASRALWLFVKKHPYYIKPYIPELIRSLHSLKSEGVRRSIINMLTIPDIPEKYQGELFDLCLNILESPDESIANRANSMTVLYNISRKEPGLKQELIAILEAQVPSESGAIVARVRMLLAKLHREIS